MQTRSLDAVEARKKKKKTRKMKMKEGKRGSFDFYSLFLRSLRKASVNEAFLCYKIIS